MIWGIYQIMLFHKEIIITILSHMQKLSCRYSQYCSYNGAIMACINKSSIPSPSSFSLSQTFACFVRSWRRSTMMVVGRWQQDHQLFLLNINIWWEVQRFIFCLHFDVVMESLLPHMVNQQRWQIWYWIMKIMNNNNWKHHNIQHWRCTISQMYNVLYNQ